MGNATDGAKAGVVAGIPYGIIEAIVAYFALLSMKSTVISTIGSKLPPNTTLTANQVFGIALLVAPVAAVIAGVVVGLILGAIYGWLFDRIPGGKPVIKGLIFGVVFWLLVSVVGGVGNLQEGTVYYLTSAGSGLLTALLFGVLLGYFYGRFSAPKQLLVGPT
jgi:F0F1-type ATP synthase assembly protein I